MVFFSYEFFIFILFAFLSIKIVNNQLLYFIISIFFYFIFGGLYGMCLVLLLVAALFYIKSHKLIITLCILTLIYFKYSSFLISFTNINLKINNIFILGLSFFIFEIIHLAIERERNNLKLDNKLKVLNFIFFWPSMIAGPIKRYSDFNNINFSLDKNSNNLTALKSVFFGFILKYFADNLSAWINIHDILYIQSPNIFDKLIFLLILGFRIYWDFAGYSMIAIGFALLLGIKVPQNFNYPYVAHTLIDFWQRWHISLSLWIRDYLYIPLGGNKKNKYFNILASMALCGLWHGSSLNFLIWGVIHGICLIIFHYIMSYNDNSKRNNNSIINRSLKFLGFIVTQSIVFLAWLPFFYSIDNCYIFFNSVKL